MVRSLGVGATSEVFEVINTSTKQHSALKVFSQLVLSDTELLDRLQDEVEILGQLRHQNIVGLLSHQRSQEGQFALELELIDGTDLRQWLRSFDLSLIEPKLWLLAQVARGLGAAHEMGVIHRDLKPENVLVSQLGEVKITDFGLARQINRLTITRLGLLVGSLGYMAPEVIAGQKATTLSDIFSFGVIAYEVLCGRSPFEGETPQALIRQITDGVVRPPRQINPRIPENLATLIEQCLEKDPRSRPDGIWLLEAHLMSALSASGLLPYGRALVGLSSRQSVIAAALKTKLHNLKTQIEAAKKLEREGLAEVTSEEKVQSNKRAMAALTEIMDLFPEEEGLADMIKGVRGEAPGGLSFRYRLGFFTVLFVCGVGAFAWFWPAKILPPEIQPIPAPISQMVSRKLENSAQKSGPPAIPTPREFSQPKPVVESSVILGSIQFDVDPDVSIFVDDKFIPQAQWDHLPIEVGEHQVRMVKEGFVPIDQMIQVTGERPSVIRARGQP